MLLNDIKKIPKLLFSFMVFAIGISLVRLSDLGLNSWGVFHDGLSVLTNISFGNIIQIVGVVVLTLTLFIKVYPGLGTVLNVIFIGMFIDIVESLNLFPYTDIMYLRYIYFTVGLILSGFGMALYITCEMGTGPRDGLLIGLVRLTKINVRYIKPIIEIIVMFIGIVIGGNIGVGTVISMFFSGYIVDKFFIFLKYDPRNSRHTNFSNYIKRNSLVH